MIFLVDLIPWEKLEIIMIIIQKIKKKNICKSFGIQLKQN